jgi:aminoglycoside phosphotransferase (APT) family kinase protein
VTAIADRPSGPDEMPRDEQPPGEPVDALADEPFDALARFLHESCFDHANRLRIGAVRRPRGGMSWETFFVRVDVGGDSASTSEWLVVRRAPADVGPLGPYDARKDAVVFRSLHGHVPVPRFVAYSDDPEVFRRPFSVVELVRGESDDLYRIERWPTWQTKREELGRQIVEALGALHRFAWRDSELLTVVDQPESIAMSIERMVAWYVRPYEGHREDVLLPQVFWRDLAVWLVDNAPEIDPSDFVVVHGDFRFGNMIWDGTRLAAIVDWERAMIGDPMSNLGFFSMPMARRRRPELMGMALSFEQLAELYAHATGTPVDRRRFQYYMIFWQFIEGSLGSRPQRSVTDRPGHGGTDQSSRYSSAGTLPLGPVLHMNQTTRLIEAFERGDHDVL